MSKRVYYFENTSYNSKSGNRHNKFYRMIELDNGKFLAEWGSIGKNPLGTKEYSMNEWYDTQTKKENKGYIFGNDPGNTTHDPLPVRPSPPKYDPEKVDSVKNRLGLVVDTLRQKENSDLHERVFTYYNEFLENPKTFTPTRIKEVNEIYNRFR